MDTHNSNGNGHFLFRGKCLCGAALQPTVLEMKGQRSDLSIAKKAVWHPDLLIGEAPKIWEAIAQDKRDLKVRVIRRQKSCHRARGVVSIP